MDVDNLVAAARVVVLRPGVRVVHHDVDGVLVLAAVLRTAVVVVLVIHVITSATAPATAIHVPGYSDLSRSS